jgi:hypothetical protein
MLAVHPGIFGDPKECREHARQCFESARSASTLAMMARFEGLAHSWLRLAEDLERTGQLAVPLSLHRGYTTESGLLGLRELSLMWRLCLTLRRHVAQEYFDRT